VGSQTTTSTGSFTVIPPPSVTGFNPQSGIVGTPVTITGANFSATTANNTVKFGGVAATIQSNTTTSIVALVPATGLTGPITVEVSSIGMGSSSNNFTVGPIVTGFNPTTGIVGDVITITGLNFSSTDANNVVKFNNTTAVATASTTTSITTAIPAGATTGPLSVTIGSLTGSGNTDFTVIPAPIISSFNPGSGEVGDQVIINGNNFSTTSTNNVVKFNGTTANVSASTATTITTSVPTGATTGKITVTVNNQTTTSDSDFSIIVVSNLVQITNETFITKFAKGATDLKVSITVNDASKVSVMNFKSRGISEAASALKTTVVTASANKFEKIFAAAELSDAIGLVYYFEGTDTNGNTIISNTGKGFIEYPTTSTDHTIPSLKFGETVADYQIISVPLVLEDKKVTTVLASLGTYDNTQWRLFDYNTTNGDNREYPGFTNIEIGKGYWLIARNQVVINPGAGSAPQVDDATPFVMNLAAGWNLVGNPYNFRISWTDVLAANPTITGVGNLKVFNSGTLGESNVIDRYRGAFVFSNTATALKIPVLRNTTLGGGRVGSSEIDLDADQWTLPLEITNGKLSNQTGGIGMNPYATLLSKDDFDEVAVPLPAGLTLFEIQFHHPEVAANFTKEIVPTTENYSWEFSIKNESAEELTIKWPADLFVESNREIYLYETTTKTVINMKEKFSAMITPAMRSIRIISGSKNYIEKELDDLLPFVSTAYPNPAKDIVNFPIRVAAKQGESMVRVQVINGLSQQTEIYNTSLKPGNHNIQWKPTETGLHFIKVSVGSQSTYLKVIVQ
jgi:hypothetical protein